MLSIHIRLSRAVDIVSRSFKTTVWLYNSCLTSWARLSAAAGTGGPLFRRLFVFPPALDAPTRCGKIIYFHSDHNCHSSRVCCTIFVHFECVVASLCAVSMLIQITLLRPLPFIDLILFFFTLKYAFCISVVGVALVIAT